MSDQFYIESSDASHDDLCMALRMLDDLLPLTFLCILMDIHLQAHRKDVDLHLLALLQSPLPLLIRIEGPNKNTFRLKLFHRKLFAKHLQV